MKHLVAASLLMLCGCKSNQSQQANPDRPPGPPTMLGQNMTPAFSEVGAYVRMVQTNAAQAFINGGERPFVAPCDQPGIDIAMRPERNKIESCTVRANSLDDIRLAARISNGWLIVSDSHGTRRVKTSEFPDLTR